MDLTRYRGKRVALIGAGVSNMPLIDFFKSLGAEVTLREKKTEEELGAKASEIRSLGAELIAGDGYLDGLSEDVIVRSPGIRPDIEPFSAAAARGADIVCEMELFARHAPCPVFAVTGSDGKSTTTTILSMLLMPMEDGRAYLGGNIEEPLFQKVSEMTERDLAAVELSSFQLMRFDHPVVSAVITNVTPNHLNWHTGMEEYIEAKKNILKKAQRAVLNFENEVTRRIGEGLIASGECEVMWFSLSKMTDADCAGALRCAYLDGGKAVVREQSGDVEALFNTSDVVLPGLHNIANYMAASLAAWGYTSVERIREVASEFGGVRHRLQLVGDAQGVRYYNSSIDSSPTRTAAAVSALRDTAPERGVVIICGGYDKNIPFEPLAETLLGENVIKAVVLTGATAEKIDAAITSSSLHGKGEKQVVTVKAFDDAVRTAASLAGAGDTVLLSPACASFDAFPNFEVRGERFTQIVREITEKHGSI